MRGNTAKKKYNGKKSMGSAGTRGGYQKTYTTTLVDPPCSRRRIGGKVCKKLGEKGGSEVSWGCITKEGDQEEQMMTGSSSQRHGWWEEKKNGKNKGPYASKELAKEK